MSSARFYIGLCLTLFAASSWGQCPNDNTFKSDKTPTGVGNTQSELVFGGEYITATVCKGASYTFSTCGFVTSVFDTEITLYDDLNGDTLGYNDDNCGLSLLTSEITWTATRNTVVRVLIDNHPCTSYLVNAAFVEVTMNSACGSNPVNVPTISVVSTPDQINCNGGTDGSIDAIINDGLGFVGSATNDDCISSQPICGDGTFSVNTGSGGNYDVSNACFSKEYNATWFEIRIAQTGSLEFEITPQSTGVVDYLLYDFDFALYGPNQDCGNLGTPLRCSAYRLVSLLSGQTIGLDAAETDTSEAVLFDNNSNLANGLVAPLNVDSGETYYILVNYPALSGLATAPDFKIEFGGTAGLDCQIKTEYVIEWTGPNGYTSTDEDINNLDSGNYIIQVIDHWGNVGYDTVYIYDPDPLIASKSSNDVTCNGNADGSLTVSPAGGVSPYAYSWNTGDTTNTLNNLGPGTYSLTITDSRGCTRTENITITEPGPVNTSLIYHY